MANKMAVRVAHFVIAILAGALVGYSWLEFRNSEDIYPAVGAGLIAALVVMILLPKLHKSGGGGGE